MTTNNEHTLVADPQAPYIEDGDMVFFPGHCGLFVHGWRFLHANAHDMEVSLHSFSDVIDRADAADAGVTSIRRLEYAAAVAE